MNRKKVCWGLRKNECKVVVVKLFFGVLKLWQICANDMCVRQMLMKIERRQSNSKLYRKRGKNFLFGITDSKTNLFFSK